MKLKLTFNKKTYHAKMLDTPLVKQIIDMCPFELTYKRNNENEYYASLPKSIDAKGSIFESIAKKNQIWCFADWNAFCLLFNDCDISPWKIIHLGDFVEDISEDLRKSPSSIKIKCELDN